MSRGSPEDPTPPDQAAPRGPASGALHVDASSVRAAVFDAAASLGIGIAVAFVEGDTFRPAYANEAASRMFEMTPEALLAGDALDFLAPEGRARARKRLAEGPKGEIFDTTTAPPGGGGAPITCALTPVEIEGRAAAVLFLLDRRHQRAAEEALRTAEARFRQLSEAAPDAIVILTGTTIQYANAAAAHMLGVPSAAALGGVDMAEFLEPDAMTRMRTRIAHVRSTGERLTPIEYTARRRDGSRITAEITSLPLGAEHGNEVIAIARDVTDRVVMRAQLERADRLAALGTLAAGVAHEINNPLTYMGLAAQALERQVSAWVPEEDARRRALSMVADIQSGVERVAGIVRDLKSFARPDTARPGPTDLVAVLASAERMVSRNARHRATVTLHVPPLPAVHGDAARLEQVFVNLLLNAVQAMEGRNGGQISVRAGETPAGRVFVEVHDDGPGIAAENLRRIFDPFFTTKPVGVGTGLGLTICHQIVQQLGGEITVDSPPGQGTTFRVGLMRASETEAGRTPPRESVRTQAAGLRILVVDDEPALVAAVAAMLRPKHDVTVVHDGAAALALLRDDGAFDVILVDLMMPGTTGMEVFDRVAAERPGLERRMLLMTGGATLRAVREFLARVPNTFVEKPFTSTQLERAILDIARTRA